MEKHTNVNFDDVSMLTEMEIQVLEKMPKYDYIHKFEAGRFLSQTPPHPRGSNPASIWEPLSSPKTPLPHQSPPNKFPDFYVKM